MLRTTVILLVCTLFGSDNARASVVLVDLLPGNDNDITEIEQAIEAYKGSHLDLLFYDKVENAVSTSKTLSTTISVIGGSKSAGTWDVIDPVVMISYLTVKASNDYALYEVLPSSNFGVWSTQLLVNKHGIPHDLSHFSLWTTQVMSGGDAGGAPAVPEPATCVLVSGAIGVLYVARRRFGVRCLPEATDPSAIKTDRTYPH